MANVSTVLDLKLAFTKPMSLASLSDSLVTLTGEQHVPFVDGSTDPATSGNGISFRLGDLEGGGHPMSSLISVSMKAGSNSQVLQIRSVRNSYGQAKWRLTEDQVYHLTFAPQQSNPTDDDSNPLNLLGGELTFDFRTATLPKIDFYASKIGNQRIRVRTIATSTRCRIACLDCIWIMCRRYWI